MKQRDVEEGGLRWTCVQALAGVTGDAAAAAEHKMDAEGAVPVVCTPSGAAQSVRLTLPPDWTDSMTDEQLGDAIKKAQRGPS